MRIVEDRCVGATPRSQVHFHKKFYGSELSTAEETCTNQFKRYRNSDHCIFFAVSGSTPRPSIGTTLCLRLISLECQIVNGLAIQGIEGIELRLGSVSQMVLSLPRLWLCDGRCRPHIIWTQGYPPQYLGGYLKDRGLLERAARDEPGHKCRILGRRQNNSLKWIERPSRVPFS
jgi:hypothetical protein